MSVFKIAFNNFKSNLKVYTMFFISNVFSVIVLSNFMILMDGDALNFLGNINKEYLTVITRVLIVVLIYFLFFFIWYSSNIFLKNRKKEIGIYTFMGLDSVTVGKIYFIEIMLIGISSCILGTGIGVILSKFFQMIVFKLAEFNVDIKFNVTVNSLIYTFIAFMGIFLIMSIKGFINIIRSNVIDLLNDSKKADNIKKVGVINYLIGIISVGLVIAGYVLVLKNKQNAFYTLILVCIGTEGLFGSMLPVIFDFLKNRKSILYNGENIITINNLAYRLKKNYKTYATIAILTACTVTVLGTAVSMKKLYTDSAENYSIFSMSFTSSEEISNKDKIKDALSEIGNEKYEYSTKVLIAKESLNNPDDASDYNLIMSYSQLVDVLKANGNEESLSKINEEMVSGDQAIFMQRPGTLASLVIETETKINDIPFKVSCDNIKLKTFGSAFNYTTLVISDENYEKVKPQCQVVNFYGVKIENDEKFLDENIAKEIIEKVGSYVDIENTKGHIGILEIESISYLKGVYAIGAFLFLVFILAEASIIYIRIYSDANEDKNKYKILLNIGAQNKLLRKSINKEVALFYVIPVTVGLIHSFFAMKGLGEMLFTDLNFVFALSVLASVVVFGISAVISMRGFKKIVGA